MKDEPIPQAVGCETATDYKTLPETGGYSYGNKTP
jgi:hypothetical protein